MLFSFITAYPAVWQLVSVIRTSCLPCNRWRSADWEHRSKTSLISLKSFTLSVFWIWHLSFSVVVRTELPVRSVYVSSSGSNSEIKCSVGVIFWIAAN